MANKMFKTKNLQLKPFIIALAVVAISVLGGAKSEVYASITGGTAKSNPATNVYIPNDYFAGSGDSGEVLVKAGIAIPKLRYLEVTFSFDSTKLSILQPTELAKTGDALFGKAATITSTANTYYVKYDMTSSVAVAADQTLFRLPISIAPVSGTSTISIFNTGTLTIKTENTPSTDPLIVMTSPTFSAGMITITAAATCPNNCGDHGACNFETRQCACNTGFSGLVCNECAAGYTGYPQCAKETFSNLKGMVLTLSPDTISKLTVEERKKAYSSVYVIFKSVVTNFAQKIKLGTVEADVACISVAPDDLAKIRECSVIFKENIEDTDIGPGWKSSMVNGLTGVVKLEARIPGETLDGILSTTGDVLVVPAMDYTVVLDPLASYKTRVIGIIDDDASKVHTIKDLNFNDVKWMPQPTNRLKSSALNGGLLERGDEVGTGPLYVELEKADKTKVQSNQLTVEVTGGPLIDYARVIGSGSIERGARVNLSVKVSDVDTISDIQDIRTSIVRPTDPSPTKNNTYTEIRADASAVWFTAVPFADEVTVTSQGTAPATTSSTTTSTATTSSSTTATTAAANYRIYQIPVEIPQDTNLVDGNYKLVLIITDKAGHSSTAVIPLRIGKAASGDVNGDSKINMLDVILAYQISNGKIVGTPAQIEAANLDGKGNVTMLDVVLLFNKVNKK